MKAVVLWYGTPHPTKSTIILWGNAALMVTKCSLLGDHRLKPAEHAELSKYFSTVRQVGQSIDRTVMCCLAETVVPNMIVEALAVDHLYFSQLWARAGLIVSRRNFRKRPESMMEPHA